MSGEEWPHEGVYVRLGLSRLHGIGVFAIRDIEAGTNIFGNDRSGFVWVEKATLDSLPLSEADRLFYHDFGMDVGDAIGCPTNFHNLTPGWYLNRAEEGAAANIAADEELNFYALRLIEAGEELLIDYGQLNAMGHAYRLRRTEE